MGIDAMKAWEEQEVRRLGDTIGYGRTMQLAEQLWREKITPEGHAGAEHTTGPCATFMVPCPHTVKDRNGHCEICCGAGRVAKWVAAHLASPLRKRPIAWMRYVASAKPCEFRYRSDDGDPPEDEGWIALYRRGQP